MNPAAITPYQANIRDEYDVIKIRQHAREIAREAGLSLVSQAKLSAAISWIGNTILGCSDRPLFSIRTASAGKREALEISCRASIATPSALDELGQSLNRPDMRRLPDELSVEQSPDLVVLTLRMWLEA